jgi:hypothetical protein
MSIEETIRLAVREATEPLRSELERVRAKLDELGGASGDRLLGPAEIERLSGYSAATVKRWVREGLLRRHGTARGFRVSERELRQHLSRLRKVDGEAKAPTEAQILEMARARAGRGQR